MSNQVNTPYRKQYDEQGNVIGQFPYISEHPNRKQRRAIMQKQRHRGNHKGNSIVIVQETPTKFVAYKRIIQFVKDTGKAIFHYIKK